MIKVNAFLNGEDVVRLEVTGHSGYSEQGSDIVCAGVSTLVETAEHTLNTYLKANVNFEADEEFPSMILSLDETIEKEKLKSAKLIMNHTLFGLKLIQTQFKKYIDIKERKL